MSHMFFSCLLWSDKPQSYTVWSCVITHSFLFQAKDIKQCEHKGKCCLQTNPNKEICLWSLLQYAITQYNVIILTIKTMSYCKDTVLELAGCRFYLHLSDIVISYGQSWMFIITTKWPEKQQAFQQKNKMPL